MEQIRKHYKFTGQVQGVGFRYSAQYLAKSFGLTGWVQNEWDGSVSMEAQGDPKALEQFVQKLEERKYIQIDQISEATIPLEREYGFQVKY